MDIWLDTVDELVIKDAVARGILSGVTTNPTILSKTQNVKATLTNLLDWQDGPVAVQVTSLDTANIIKEARAIANFLPGRIIVKIPMTKEGCSAMRQLKEEDVHMLGTAILHPSQALLATLYGVDYISPYFSHMEDNHAQLKKMIEILRKGGQTKMLAASLRELDHIVYCALLGAEAVTIKAELYNELISDSPKVEGFIQKFANDWKGAHGHSTILDFLQKH